MNNRPLGPTQIFKMLRKLLARSGFPRSRHHRRHLPASTHRTNGRIKHAQLHLNSVSPLSDLALKGAAKRRSPEFLCWL